MTVFSNLEAARKEGFHRYDFDRELQLYVVIREERRRDGTRFRCLAYAKEESIVLSQTIN